VAPVVVNSTASFLGSEPVFVRSNPQHAMGGMNRIRIGIWPSNSSGCD